MKVLQGKTERDRALVILNRGELVIASLSQAASDLGIFGGVLSGLGALKDIELGFYHLDTKSYDRRQFPEDHELLSLTGNVSLKDGQVYVHAHVSIGDTEFKVWGGHLFEATVAVTAEVALLPMPFGAERKLVEELGLATICQIAHGLPAR